MASSSAAMLRARASACCCPIASRSPLAPPLAAGFHRRAASPSSSASPCSRRQLRIGDARWGVVVQARPSSASRSPADHSGPADPQVEGLAQELLANSVAELQSRLKALGLPASGRKADLARRLAEATLQQQQPAGVGASPAPTTTKPPKASKRTPAPKAPEPTPPAPTVDASAAPTSMRVEDVLAELQEVADDELVATLQDLGLSDEGSRQERLERLAVYLAQTEEEEEPAEEADDGFTEAEQLLLAERRAADAFERLIHMSRQDLYAELKTAAPPGVQVAYLARDDLAKQLSMIQGQATLAQELADPRKRSALRREVDQALGPAGARQRPSNSEDAAGQPAELAGGAAAGAAVTGFNNCGVTLTKENADRDTLIKLNSTQIKKLKVEELKVALELLGEPGDGNRYALTEQLTRVVMRLQLQWRAEADAANTALSTSVSGMPIRSLRQQLISRGLDSTGSRAALESRLMASLREEQEKAEEEREALEAQDLGPDPLEPYTSASRLLDLDPAVDVAVVFGAPGGGLKELQASLEAARCAVAALHTAWPPADALSAALLGGGKQQQEEQEEEGVRVKLVYLTRDLTALELPAGLLAGVTAADLLAGAPLHAAHAVAAASGATWAAKALGQGAAGVRAALGGGGAAAAGRAVLSVVSTVGLQPAEAARLAGALQEGAAGAGAAVLGAGAAAAGDKLSVAKVLKAEGFPVLPSHVLRAEDMEDIDKWARGLEAWVDKQGYHRTRQLFVVTPSLPGVPAAPMAVPCQGLPGARSAAESVMRARLAEVEDGAEPDISVVVEPYMGDRAVHFTVTVLDGAEGPVALLPTEVSVADVEDQVFESELSVMERNMMREGFTAEEVAEELAQQRTDALGSGETLLLHHHRKPYPFTRLVKYHHPPRLPRKHVHALRHGAALAYQKLGLKGGAQVDGWVELPAGWQDKHEHVDDGAGRPLWDKDPAVRERYEQHLLQEEAKSGGLPLSHYYHPAEGKADLSKFDPRAWLHASRNGGEATVYFANVTAGLPLDPASPAFLQAAELGMTHTATLRNLLSAAVRSPALPPAGAEGGGKRGRSKTPAAAAAAAAVALPPTPLLDPSQLSVMVFDRADEFDALQATTEWRERMFQLDIAQDRQEQDGVRQALEVLELFDTALAGGEPLPLAGGAGVTTTLPEEAGGQLPDGKQLDMSLLPFAYAEDWDPDFDEREPEAATPLDQDVGNEEAREQEEAEGLQLLRDEFPGLPEEDLMYIVMGHKGGRRIDTALVKAKLEQLEASDRTALAVDVLDECLIDEETGVVGPAPPLYRGPESEPGGYRSALRPMPQEEVDNYHLRQTRLSNARSKGVRKVWLLVGGLAGKALDSALASARDVAIQLGTCTDLQVELFVMSPSFGVLNEEAARKKLLEHRSEWLSSGVPLDELSPAMELGYIRNAEPLLLDMHKELVWALPSLAPAMQHTAAATIWSAEATSQRLGTSELALPPLEQQALQVVREVLVEAAAAGLDGVAGQWGGAVGALPIKPRLLSMADLASEAADEGALVVPMIRGGLTASVVQLLMDCGAPFAGSGPVATLQCSNKAMCAEAVDALGEESGVWSMPFQMIVGEALVESSEDDKFCAVMLEEARGVLFPFYDSPIYRAAADDDAVDDPTKDPDLKRIKAASGEVGVPPDPYPDADEEEEEAENDDGDEEEDGEEERPRRKRAASAAATDAAGDASQADAVAEAEEEEEVVEDEDEEEEEEIPPLSLRPIHGAEGVGVVRIDCARDLELYGQALGLGVSELPSNTLAAPHRPVPMPQHVPEVLIFEPFVETDSVLVLPRDDQPGVPPEIVVVRTTGWVEASICLLGGLGTMEPLGLTLKAAMHPLTAGVRSPAKTAPAAAAAGGEGEGDEEEFELLRRLAELEGDLVDVAEEEEEEGSGKEGGDAAGSPAPAAAAAAAEVEAAAGKKQRRRSKSSSAAASAAEAGAEGGKAAVAAAAAGGEGAGGPSELADGWVVEDDPEEEEVPVPVHLTPAPAEVLSAEVAQAAMMRARDLVDHIGAQGLVKVDAFVARETGELIVIEVDTTPSLAQGSLVYQQALQRPEGPLTPTELLRSVVSLGLLATAKRDEEEDEQAAALGLDEELGDLDADDEGAELDEAQEEELAEFEGAFEDGGGAAEEEDLMDGLAAMQGEVPYATPSMVGPNDADELFLSSTGRAARRGGRRAAAVRDDIDGDDGGFVGGDVEDYGLGAGGRGGVRGDDFDFDGQGPDDPEFQDNWKM